MIHIEIQPGAIATFESTPTPEALDTLRDVVAYFSDPIETFLSVNAGEIPASDRAALREVAAKAIRDEKTPIDTRRCPAHLREAFRRLVVAAAYKARNKGQFVNPKIEYLP